MDRLHFLNAFGDWSGDALEFNYIEFQSTGGLRRCASMYRLLPQLHVPISALKGVEFTRKTQNCSGGIRFLPRPGASPFHEVAGAEFHPANDPLCFDFDADQELLIEYYATEIASAIDAHGMSDTRADRFLISVPNPTVRLVGLDGAVDLRGNVLRFTWGLEANPRKRLSVHRSTLRIDRIRSITWMDWKHDPDKIGYLRFRPVGIYRPKHQTVDATTVLLETDEQFAEALVFAATVVERMHPRNLAPSSSKKSDDLSAPQHDATELLRKLGELRDAGVLTEDEFQAKKKEILDRL
ncbi:uncharacterized protein DUF4429 [Actinomadura pelletieri DSM 43383]|uniref:Uncharacterized protein DUF4429 n=1 Tax=Actinomadura pelletieri DSM 43383 TaxID=1120940 RepID=A0A495QBB7_9ACTN|nr:DUF4429 domain-containing protein [Actinomadura pelletieri]RKS68982.1 uncharacterized protein DUF4429 [Actinomadura pelletieri DSM 43383]